MHRLFYFIDNNEEIELKAKFSYTLKAYYRFVGTELRLIKLIRIARRTLKGSRHQETKEKKKEKRRLTKPDII